MPTVSICIPTYENPSSLKKLLDSIIIQDFIDYEIVVTDNSRSQSVEKLLNMYNFTTLRYFKNNNNIGPVANWNKALELATGDLIKIMFSDDWFSTQRSLSCFVNMMKPSYIFFAFSGSLQVGQDFIYSRSINRHDVMFIKKKPYRVYCGNSIGAPSATIFRRTALRFDENLKWLVDIDFYIQYLSQKVQFTYSTDPLISIGVSNLQLTVKCENDPDVNIFEYTYLYNKYGLSKYMYTKKKYLEMMIKFKQEALVLNHGFSGKFFCIIIRLSFITKSIVFKVRRLVKKCL